MVLNKYGNLLENRSHNLFTEALVITEVKYDWNEKMMKALQKKGYNKKVILNMKREMTLIKCKIVKRDL